MVFREGSSSSINIKDVDKMKFYFLCFQQTFSSKTEFFRFWGIFKLIKIVMGLKSYSEKKRNI